MTTARPSSPIVLDRREVWEAIEGQRAAVADLLAGLTAGEWSLPSLCAGWTVRDVAAHLTLQELGPRAALAMMARYRGNTNRAIRETARHRGADWPVERIVADIRRTAGSRRHNVGVTYRETLIDALVHGQDIAIPVGRPLDMPVRAAAEAASRVWTMRWPPPFPIRRRLRGFRLVATDAAWSVGEGLPVYGPMSAILLLSCGRLAALPHLHGEGAAQLVAAVSSLR